MQHICLTTLSQTYTSSMETTFCSLTEHLPQQGVLERSRWMDAKRQAWHFSNWMCALFV